jgi:hypothetical protein
MEGANCPAVDTGAGESEQRRQQRDCDEHARRNDGRAGHADRGHELPR